MVHPSAEASVLGGYDHSLVERSARGHSITEAVTQLTGTAINPLFGVTVLGMYHYFSTPEHLRDQLPFYDQPHVWGGMLLIILLMFFNSTICEAMPFLKIPLNALGDLVNKGGACVVLPVVLHQFAQMFAVPTANMLAIAGEWIIPTAYAANGIGGEVGDGWFLLGWAVSLTFGLVAYATVWVVWNVIDVTILVLPVPCLDATLKSIRIAVVGLLFGASWLNPWLGLLLSLGMVLICWYLSGWAFRLSFMGFVFATDFLLWRKSGTTDAVAGIPAFITATGGKQWKLPARQYGHLRRGADGTLSFIWRSWLVSSERRIDLGKPSEFQGGSSLLYPVVLESTGENVLFRLPPRYHRDSQAIAIALGLRGCQDISVVRNAWKALRRFFSAEAMN